MNNHKDKLGLVLTRVLIAIIAWFLFCVILTPFLVFGVPINDTKYKDYNDFSTVARGKCEIEGVSENNASQEFLYYRFFGRIVIGLGRTISDSEYENVKQEYLADYNDKVEELLQDNKISFIDNRSETNEKIDLLIDHGLKKHQIRKLMDKGASFDDYEVLYYYRYAEDINDPLTDTFSKYVLYNDNEHHIIDINMIEYDPWPMD